MGTAEGKSVPRKRGSVELSGFQALVIAAEGAPERRRGEDGDDRRAAWIRVHVDEPVEPDVEAAFFARFADRRGHQRLAAIDVTAGEDPLPVSGIDGALDEDDAVGRRLDDRADGNLGVD